MAFEQGRAVAPYEVTNHSHISLKTHYSLSQTQGDVFIVIV